MSQVQEKSARPSPLAALKTAVQQTKQGKYLQALNLFEEQLHHIEDLVVDKDKEERIDLYYLSFYSLCQAMVMGDTQQPRRLCQSATESCSPSADLYFNLGMIFLRAHKRSQAMDAFRLGLKINPDHGGLVETVKRMRKRQRPLFSFLGRKHPLNRYTGILRNKVRKLWESGDDLFAGA